MEAAKKTHQAKAIAGKGDDVNENDKNGIKKKGGG